MINKKRLWICIIGGVITAMFCLAGRQIIYGFPEITLQSVSHVVANRILFGFTIGISAWKINHFVHGAVLGLLFSLSVSIGFLVENQLGFFLFNSAGMLYGVFIEWLSTDLFKAPK